METLYPISPFNSFFTYSLDPVPSFCQTTFHQLYSLLLPVTNAGIETLWVTFVVLVQRTTLA